MVLRSLTWPLLLTTVYAIGASASAGASVIAGAGAGASAASPVCSGATATSIGVSWAAQDDTDMYYVALSRTPTSRPYALQTTALPKITLIDLVPETSYYITVRSHPSSDNIVWGWRAPSAAALKCATSATRTEAPHALRRIGDTPNEHSIQIAWNAAVRVAVAEAEAGHEVGVRLLGGSWRWERAAGAAAHTLQGLAAGEEYQVAVRDTRSGKVGDPLMMRTAAAGATHTVAYRISEYTFEVDFLENHDAANKLAMPVYVQNYGGQNETANTENHAFGQNYTMDECLAAMTAACPQEKGNSFSCMACADLHRATVDKACSTFSDGDDSKHGWGVHFYCGIGWPGSSFQRSPVTEYCVEHMPAPQTDPIPGGEGYAQYVSCNSDECDGALLPKGNTPRLPTCICWVWDDRMLSQQPKKNTLAACSPDVLLPWVGAKQCNCSAAPGPGATSLQPESAMANYVGRSKVYIPYYFYKKPLDSYPVSVPVGDNLSFPRKGACKEGQKLGDGGCTWRRLSTSRMLYGADLVAAGWNTTDYKNVDPSGSHPGEDHKVEIEHTFKNIDAFNRAVDTLDQLRTPRCCGC